MSDLSAEDLTDLIRRAPGRSVHRALVELRRLRKMEARLTEWAEQLDRDGERAGPGSVTPFIATELRNRMKGKS
jgi:hypothetical protein